MNIRRLRRFLRWGCLTGIILAVATLGVLRIPAVQTWLVERAVARQPGWKLEADKIDVGLGGLDARGIDFSMPGINARSAPLAVRVKTGALLRRQVVIEQIAVDDLHIELTPSKMAASNEPVAGLLELLQAPLSWTVADTRLNARVGLREGDDTLATGELRLTGGGLSPGAPGVFNYEFSVASALLPPGPDNVVRSKGVVRITQNDRHGIAAVEIDGDLRLPRYGAFTPPEGKLKLVLENKPGAEHYQLDIGFADEARLILRTGITAGARATSIDVDFELRPALLARIDPKLASLGIFKGQLKTLVDLLSLQPADTRLTLKNDASPFIFTAEQNGSAHSGRAKLQNLPLAWANGWLAEGGLKIADGLVNATWDVSAAQDGALELTSPQPVQIGPIAVEGAALPGLVPLSFSLSPRLSFHPARGGTLSIPDLRITSSEGDHADVTLNLAHTLADNRTRATGTLSAALPTLLAGAGQPLPFLATARWDATLTGDHARVDTLEFFARKDPAAVPHVSLALRQPLRFALSSPTTTLEAASSQDLLRFAVNGLPLSWISRYAPDFAITGAWAEGESVLRRSDAGGFSFVTRVPWTFTGITVAKTGDAAPPLLDGNLSLSPELIHEAGVITARLNPFHADDAAGNRIEGEAGFRWKTQDKTFVAALNLDATLPALPHSQGAFGPIAVSLKTRASTADGAVSQIEFLELQVRNAAGPLLTLDTAQPVLAVQKANGETVLHALEPLRLKTAAIDLAWLRPWLAPGTEIAGRLAETEFAIHAEPQTFRLQPLKPLRIDNVSLTEAGSPRIRDVALSLSPSAGLTVIHQTKPDFQLVFQGTAKTGAGTLAVTGKTAAEFDISAGFIGNTQTTLPQSIDLKATADLGVLNTLPAASALPAGKLTTRLNGHLLGGEPLDFHARLENVPAPSKPGETTRTTLAPLEINARGKVNGPEKRVAFDVDIQHLTSPRAGDASFGATLALDKGILDFTSALRSKFLDAGAVLELASVLTGGGKSTSLPPESPSTAIDAIKPAPAKTVSIPPARMPQLGVPFWSVLRGRFDLDLGAVLFAPYRIEQVRGRLDLTESRLSLTDLTGTMFAGKWSGGLHIDYDPRPEADHFLTGGFHIEQFETARAVQTVFPNEFGSFDARINLDTAVRSEGNGLWELLNRAEGEFAIEGRNGIARLTHPAAGTASTLLVLGGTVSFSPELRALGRLLRKFAEMPVDELRVSGERDMHGNIALTEFRLDSPQARLIGRGSVPAQDGLALAGRPLSLGLELFARDEIGLILSRMKLLERRETSDGYRKMEQPFTVTGEVGRPDASSLYDLLARAATGSRGTWGFIMRKVQIEVEKQRATAK